MTDTNDTSTTSTEQCEHSGARPVGVGEDREGPFVVVECLDCGENWDEYRDWSLDASTERESYRLAEDVVLINGIVDRTLYSALRYHQKPEYDHIREDVLEEIEELRDYTDEILERERNTEDETND